VEVAYKGEEAQIGNLMDSGTCSYGAAGVDSIPTGRYVLRVEHVTAQPSARTGARQKIIDAAIALIRERGYAATSVDDLCGMAGVTKGAFFHHFKSKDTLAIAATDYWIERSAALFEAAPYRTCSDPLDRILGYLDFRSSMLSGTLVEFSCLAGTMVQEVYASHPAIARVCETSICGHAATLEADIAAAMKRYGLRAHWTAASLALHTQAVLQGAIILAKAKGGAAVAIESIEHLRRYIELLFKRKRRTRKKEKGHESNSNVETKPARRGDICAGWRVGYFGHGKGTDTGDARPD
jgi:TetR/AcrR family transcriptional repressor of nem operon